ncbi:ABC transporter substrate-binding protein [Granulosicoccus sp. 3-233]|uniref:ABC transporter substrate-binding protein n=1 Tax=Granulosicoccus sp. 3-233 TaxID=3417969 RepID=UPI003D353711
MSESLVKKLCTAALALAAVAVSSQAISQNAGGTMVMIAQPEPPSLAPYLSTSGPIGLVAPKIYNGLLDYDLDLNPVPELAASWEVSDDGLTVTFKLQEGVTWHDGEPFSSADVQFSIMEVLKKFHPRGPNSFREVSSIDTPDAVTAIFNLERPAPYMMRALSAYESPIVPKHLLEGKDIREAELSGNPVGTGPFKFVEWKKGQYIRLDKNENYWKDGLPLLDRIVARIIPDASTRTAAMESGEVHYGAFGAIPNIDVIRLRDQDDIGVTTDGYAMINPMALIEFDTTRAPFESKALRQAISLSVDRQFLIDNIWFGYGKPATSAMTSNYKPLGLYTPSANYPASPDVAAANALLDEAGLKPDGDGVRATATIDLIPYGEDWRRLGEYMKQAMADIGVKLELRYEDVPTWLKRVYADYDFELNVNYFYQLPDPVIGVQRHYGTDQIRQGTPFVNSARYSNPEVDELLATGAVEVDPVRRGEIYAELQAILAEDMPVVNLFEMEFLTVYNEKLKDHTVSAMGAYGSFDRAWIDD